MGVFSLKKYSDSPIDKKKYSVQLGDKILNPDLREKKIKLKQKNNLHIHQDG